jgi:hypothetical protein
MTAMHRRIIQAANGQARNRCATLVSGTRRKLIVSRSVLLRAKEARDDFGDASVE